MILAAILLASVAGFAAPADGPVVMPVSQIKPGMKGIAYTIFSGDQIEKFDLVVLGVLPDLVGPKEPVILVQLLGDKVQHTGVVAGMSGSPVYIDGKLVGAIALKFGQFTKEPLAGVTPFDNMLEVTPRGPKPATTTADASQQGDDLADAERYAIPGNMIASAELPQLEVAAMRDDAYLTPIETPLVISGVNPSVLQSFREQFANYGLVATAGGAGTPQPDDAKLVPGDMVSVVLAGGDMSMAASCTVTAIVDNRIYACGHPILSLGDVQLPLARGRVIATLSSDQESTKIVTTGGIIGTLTEDRVTAVMGELGKKAPMIPMDMSINTPSGERNFHFELADSPRLTPLLVNLEVMNGLTENNAYSEGNTLQLSGEIQIAGHSPVQLENMFAPTDAPLVSDGMFVAGNVANIFQRIYANPYEQAKIERINLKLESLPERRVTSIEGAWTDTAEAVPGQKVQVKVLLRPYRGASELRTIPITIPAEADHNTSLRILVSDSAGADRTTRPISALAAATQAGGLEQYIRILNRERRNNRLYVTLLQPTTTLLLEDKELPNAPLSEVNVLNQRRGEPNATMLRESLAGEWSLPTESVVSGSASLSIRIK
jgi:SpoIVB peptidase S55